MDRAKYFESCSNTLECYLVRKYRIPVLVYDVPDPFTGDLNGQEIHIDYALSNEDKLFLIAHLFGHTVQWCMKPSTRKTGVQVHIPVTDEQLQPLLDYEQGAARYALKLLHLNGIKDLDQWLTDYSACDLAYLAHFYRTGEKNDPKSFWKNGVSPLIKPAPIPRRFKPKKWVDRSNTGIVI